MKATSVTIALLALANSATAWNCRCHAPSLADSSHPATGGLRLCAQKGGNLRADGFTCTDLPSAYSNKDCADALGSTAFVAACAQT
ncbi:hypothetical protein FB567DRAFT_588677 [Paraphoma chrysanthemicola]|uniref:Uncharacterized protein n=1 Tax=Paraphoma chrysanthemicola TaxID=798071 RepID=A0A8K0RBT3_9PLEO|nr:hypothetical protein FB567DRAFT_588677 [Paraphoma chrysanthemicola]